MPETERYYTRCLGFTIVALGVFVYANTLKNEFVWDDASSILLHKNVQDPSALLRLFKEDQHAYAGGQGNFYRPLLATTFLIDFWLSYSGPTIHQSNKVITELSPMLFHIHSIFWHCLAALFYMLILRNFRAPPLIQAAAPIIYVLHPLHTEAVAYISGRADSMSAAFMFSALYIATRESENRRPWLSSAIVLLCFVAGLLSKESSFIFPLLLAVTLFAGNKINQRKWQPNQWAALAGTAVILGIYGFLRTGKGPLNFGSDTQPPDSTFTERLAETAQSFAYYVQLLFAPAHLHMERTLDHATSTTTIIGLLSILVCLSIIGFGLVRKRYRIFLAASWFLLTWLPISGIFPLNAPMAEHWMYVPMGGFLWIFLELILNPASQRIPLEYKSRYRIAVGSALCVWGAYLAMVSIQRNLDWRTNATIYEATLRENPKSSRVHFNLAVTYQDLLDNKQGAKRHYKEVLALYKQKKEYDTILKTQFWDEEIQSHYSLGQIYLHDKQYNDAASHFLILSTINPDESNRKIVAFSLYGLGQCFLYSGDPNQAQRMFDKAIELQPSLAPQIQTPL